ncbi:MAG: hypothetical protein PPHEMADM_5763 [uncultured Paraburkholderia sp.]|nr:MAG: hypothetical protein PPHEMADE_5774 [uncultured Paraburkholderia sp.]CAH2946120.1 MAG: hypothetical protein PPHEMADM_5763 [uncultured Paraburkholderia sp.]
MVATRLKAQGWIVGRKTMDEMVHGSATTPAHAAADSDCRAEAPLNSWLNALLPNRVFRMY